MAVSAVQKLRIGQEIEVDGRRYEVVPDDQGGLRLEPAITVNIQQAHRETGGRPATADEIRRFLGDIPSGGEG